MATQLLLERWLATIPSLAEHQLRVGFARSEVHRRAAALLAQAFNGLCLLVDDHHDNAREVLLAYAPTLVDAEELTPLLAARAVASSEQLPAAERLLRATTAAGHFMGEEIATGARGVMQRADGSPLTLGERRALARRPSRATLDKLLADPHPMVVRVLLANSRITEDDVVAMVSRRPATPQVIREIGKTWCRRGRVRMALVQNPGSPPAVSIPLLNLLSRPELRQVARANNLLPVVRSTAHELCELRPPMAATEIPTVTH